MRDCDIGIFIEGRPEGEHMPDPYGDRGQVC
jgi:hypothetical protein